MARRTVQALDVLASCAAVALAAHRLTQALRRPEVEFCWWTSTEGPWSGYRTWGADEAVAVEPGGHLFVRAAVKNVGSGTSSALSYNMLAPASVEIVRWDAGARAWEQPREGAENEKVGLAPEHSVKWFALERRWPPSLVWVQIYRLAVPGGHPPGPFRLGVEVADPRFDRVGPCCAPKSVEIGRGSRFDSRRVSVPGAEA